MNLQDLNNKVLLEINKYLKIDIYGKQIACPYYINFVENEFVQLMNEAEISAEKITEVRDLYKNNKSNYGWYRGKGTPEQIEHATKMLAGIRDYDLNRSTIEAVSEFMKMVGIGIDCSGYVYNILSKAFDDNNFINSLDWVDDKHTVSRANVLVFCNKASELIDIKDVRSLDLLIIKNPRTKKNEHIILFVKKGQNLYITQSTFSMIPAGVRIDKFEFINNKSLVKSDNELNKNLQWLYNSGLVEFRRLKYLS